MEYEPSNEPVESGETEKRSLQSLDGEHRVVVEVPADTVTDGMPTLPEPDSLMEEGTRLSGIYQTEDGEIKPGIMTILDHRYSPSAATGASKVRDHKRYGRNFAAIDWN